SLRAWSTNLMSSCLINCSIGRARPTAWMSWKRDLRLRCICPGVRSRQLGDPRLILNDGSSERFHSGLEGLQRKRGVLTKKGTSKLRVYVIIAAGRTVFVLPNVPK